MKLGQYIRLTLQDIPGTPPWWSRFLERLNPLLENLYEALKRLRIDDNFDGTYLDAVTRHAAFTRIQLPKKLRPRDVHVASIDYFCPYQFAWRPDGEEHIIIQVVFDNTYAEIPKDLDELEVKIRLRILF